MPRLMTSSHHLPRALLAALVACTAACTPAVSRYAATASAVPASAVPASAVPASAVSGTLFIVGGGTQPRPLVEHFVALAGGPGKARIAIFPMASADTSSGPEKAAELRGLGADAFVVDITRAQADADSIVRLVASATGIWFPGGDQSRLARALAGSAVLRAIHERYRAGAVVGGTSAGAAVMSDSMLTGNQRRVDGTLDTAGTGYPRVARRTIEVVPGLGFLHGAIVDQHFLRRQRANRLLSVVLERPTLLGVGIDEGTALRVDPDGTWHIEGASAALVIDARHAEITTDGAPRLGATGLRVHLLPAGATFDPRTGRATLPTAPAASAR